MRVFQEGFMEENGYKVAAAITPVAPPTEPGRLYEFHGNYSSFTINNELRYKIIYNNKLGFTKAESSAWTETFVAYWKALGQLLPAEELLNQGRGNEAQWEKVYESWKEFLQQLYQGYAGGHFPAWTIPCLYVAGKYLRNFAFKADEQAAINGVPTFSDGFEEDASGGVNKNRVSEDAARQINRLFGLCFSDRAPLEESRKWGLYYIANLLFKVYFKVNSLSLCKNVLRSLAATNTDMAPLSSFPKAHQVTFNYYAGVVHFLEENYAKAEEYLTLAWQLCSRKAAKNRQLILTYLIPCHLLTANQLPTPATLAQYPRLEQLFAPLVKAIKQGDLAGFDLALDAGEPEFVKRRIYLTLERSKDICMRNLLRKVFVVGGFDPLKEGQTDADRMRRSRISVAEFAAAMSLSRNLGPREVIDVDEVECLLANQIYKNMMKGYISRQHGMVVLNKKGAFPGTGV